MQILLINQLNGVLQSDDDAMKSMAAVILEKLEEATDEEKEED